MNENSVELIKGWYKDTLLPETKSRHDIGQVRVVNVDYDLYESTLSALNFITDLVTDGTVVMFDDWLCYRADSEKGQQAATRKWLDENNRLKLMPYRPYANVGQSFIVNIVRV